MMQGRICIFASLVGLTGCVSEQEKSPVMPEARIEKLVPDTVMAGQAFQQQPDGGSALSVLGQNLVRGSRIRINGMPLETASGDGTSLASIVPPPLFAQPGEYVVQVDTPDGRSTNTLVWKVLPSSGPAPAIRSLHPEKTAAGVAFNVQSNGLSAMGVVGENFLPGLKLWIDGKPLETSFGGVDQLGAVVPPEIFARPGRYAVVVENPDGKRSPAKEFVVTAK
jgi:hypothetical protein